jgi:hypothetical protein
MHGKIEPELSEGDRVVKKHCRNVYLQLPQARLGSSINLNPLCGVPRLSFHDGRDFDTLVRKNRV